MKKPLQATLLVGTLLALGAAWFFMTFERVQDRIWVGPTPAARANPYLAAMRFAERLGMKATFSPGATRMDALAPGSAILLPARRSGLSALRAKALDRWMNSGGHAIVEPESASDVDAILDLYGIKRSEPRNAGNESSLRVEVSDTGRPLTVARLASPALKFERSTPDILVASDKEAWLASLSVGAGRLTVMGGMERWTNREIGQHDHAELLRQILALSPSARELIVVRLPNELPLWGWLREHALPTLASAGVLIALWLAHILPRFGPVRPEAAPERRPLRDHLLAAGRFRWTHGGRMALLACAREVCHRHVTSLHPRLAQLPPEKRWRELAQKTNLDAAALAAAFTGQARSAREFVHIVGTLASIHATIARPADPGIVRTRKP